MERLVEVITGDERTDCIGVSSCGEYPAELTSFYIFWLSQLQFFQLHFKLDVLLP
jgi:hypothetical protein